MLCTVGRYFPVHCQHHGSGMHAEHGTVQVLQGVLGLQKDCLADPGCSGRSLASETSHWFCFKRLGFDLYVSPLNFAILKHLETLCRLIFAKVQPFH